MSDLWRLVKRFLGIGGVEESLTEEEQLAKLREAADKADEHAKHVKEARELRRRIALARSTEPKKSNIWVFVIALVLFFVVAKLMGC